MTQYASVEDLTADEISDNTEDVTLPNGRVVKVRGLSRYEHMLIAKNTEDGNVIERRMLRYGMVEPKMTEDQAEAWQRNGRTDVVKFATEAIRNLSGFGDGADKSGVDQVRD